METVFQDKCCGYKHFRLVYLKIQNFIQQTFIESTMYAYFLSQGVYNLLRITRNVMIIASFIECSVVPNTLSPYDFLWSSQEPIKSLYYHLNCTYKSSEP